MKHSTVKIVTSIMLTIAVSLLASCKTVEGYNQNLEMYRGVSEKTLVGYWGIPDNTYALSDGSKILRYERSHTYVDEGITTYRPQTTYHTGTVYGSYGGHYSGTSTTYVKNKTPDVVRTKACQTSFYIDNTGHVSDFQFSGNDCIADEVIRTADDHEAKRHADAMKKCNEILPAGTVGQKFKDCVAEELEKSSP